RTAAIAIAPTATPPVTSHGQRRRRDRAGARRAGSRATTIGSSGAGASLASSTGEALEPDAEGAAAGTATRSTLRRRRMAALTSARSQILLMTRGRPADR